MELPDPYFSGAVSLLETLGKKVMVQLRDGKILVGKLSTIDQFVNLVLDETVERIHFENYKSDVPRGLYLVRGENVILIAEIDLDKKDNLIEVEVTEILNMQQEKIEQKKLENERRLKFLALKGKLGADKKIKSSELLLEDTY
uniref:U6 snRNA-associated Sm-like protein LSm1 n=1 Tax=Rhabditophanes sp. KR3021 TaxID=114890 RepID=A0AC35UIP9_9BILA